MRLPINPTCRHGWAFDRSTCTLSPASGWSSSKTQTAATPVRSQERCAQVLVPDVTPVFGRNRTVVPSQRHIRLLAMKVADHFRGDTARHEASRIREQVRDSSFRAVAAVR